MLLFIFTQSPFFASGLQFGSYCRQDRIISALNALPYFAVFGHRLTSKSKQMLGMPLFRFASYSLGPGQQHGKGYIQGRFRSKNILCVESEYRFKISKMDCWGGWFLQMGRR